LLGIVRRNRRPDAAPTSRWTGECDFGGVALSRGGRAVNCARRVTLRSRSIQRGFTAPRQHFRETIRAAVTAAPWIGNAKRSQSGKVWQGSVAKSEAGDARAEARHAQERAFGQDGHAPQAGDRDRAIGGATGRGEGAEEGGGDKEIAAIRRARPLIPPLQEARS